MLIRATCAWRDGQQSRVAAWCNRVQHGVADGPASFCQAVLAAAQGAGRAAAGRDADLCRPRDICCARGPPPSSRLGPCNYCRIQGPCRHMCVLISLAGLTSLCSTGCILRTVAGHPRGVLPRRGALITVVHPQIVFYTIDFAWDGEYEARAGGWAADRHESRVWRGILSAHRRPERDHASSTMMWCPPGPCSF